MLTAILLAAATATATPSSAPAQNQQVYRPLREVVYKVATDLRIEDITESYSDPVANNPFQNGGFSSAPSALTRLAGGTGTVTVDVMAVAADGALGVRVTEQWHGAPRPSTFDGVVTSDGIVEFPESTINDVTRELLSYFGADFVPVTALSLGTAWKTTIPFAKGEVTTDYSVSGIKGNIVTIQKKQKVKGFNASSDGEIQYDPTTLVAVSGRIVKTIQSSFTGAASASEGGSDTNRVRVLNLQFDRVSDSHVQK